jgi:hypothetical protein
MLRKPHFQPPAIGGAAARDHRRRRLPADGTARCRRKAGGKGLPCLSKRGGRQGQGQGQGKPRNGKGRHGAREAAGRRRQRSRIDHKRRTDGKGGRGGKRPSFDQAARGGAERGKGKGGRQGGLKGKGRGLCRAVARGCTREKKNPAFDGACKGGACAGFIHRRRIESGLIDRRIRQAGLIPHSTNAAKAGGQSTLGFPAPPVLSGRQAQSGKHPQGRRRDH